MKGTRKILLLLLLIVTLIFQGQDSSYKLCSGISGNPMICTDVPDLSVIRGGDNYYMSSATMRMCPDIHIMRSANMTDRNIINFAYDILHDVNALNPEDGKSYYEKGPWASCIRYHNCTCNISIFSQITNKPYIFSAKDMKVAQGAWSLDRMGLPG